MSEISELLELWQEKLISDYMDTLNEELPVRDILITDVNIIHPSTQSISKSKDVLIREGKITAITDHPSDLAAITILNGTGKFLCPGLIDMHVHTRGSNCHYLFYLLNGVTTVREMGGVPWMLKRRQLVAQHQVLGPNMIIGGHMLNYKAYHHFTTVVKSESDIERVIKQQKEQGFDFIKVWNNMPLELLEVINKTAERYDMRVCGHIPSDVNVQDAIDNGFYTLEHFKGYINDRSGKLTPEDYVSITPDEEVWNCPTLAVAFFSSLSKDHAHRQLDEAYENQFISPYIRKFWISYISENYPAEDTDEMALKHQVFTELYEAGKPFVVGTDFGGGYPLCIPGFGVLREIEYLHQRLSVPPDEILKMSTINSACALQKETELGEIAKGRRADLILLSQDPLEHLITFDTEMDVIFRGRYISWQKNQEIREKILAIYQTGLNEGIAEDNVLSVMSAYYRNRDNITWLKPDFVRMFADHLLKTDCSEMAIDILKLNLELSATYADYVAIADAYMSIGDQQTAETMWKKSLEIHPYNEEVKQKILSLQSG